MPTVDVHPQAQPAQATPLTRNQVRGFWAAWGGWTLDGMDSFIYALVLVPSLRDLLPLSRIAATKGNIGYYGGLLFAFFLIGWGLAFLWGPVGDKFGRVRTLMLTVVWYSVWPQRLAGDVRRRRLAGAGAGVGAPRGYGARAMAAESRRRSNEAGLASVRGAFFRRLAATDHSELAFHAGFHQRTLGGNGLRSGGCDRARGSRWARGTASGPACFARDDARGVRDDSRMSGDALACGKARKARGTGVLFHGDDDFCRADVCQ